jgi:hypothetical protein
LRYLLIIIYALRKARRPSLERVLWRGWLNIIANLMRIMTK